MKVPFALLVPSVSPVLAFFHVPTSEELREEYPDLESDRPGNPLILCPFCRMLERSGRLDEVNQDGEETIPVGELSQAAHDFGCATWLGCGIIVAQASAGVYRTALAIGQYGSSSWSVLFNPFQNSVVDLTRLWDAPPLSHNCGFTFEKDQGQNGVSASRLNSTMAKFSARTDAEGHLAYEDVREVKLEICAEEGVEITDGGSLEADLIFAFLGGKERGYIEYSDVERFLAVDAEMPLTKAAGEVTFFYVENLDQA